VVPNQSIKYVSGLTPLHQTAFPLHTLAAVRTGPNRPMLVYMVSKSTLNGIWREAPADDRDFDPEALSPPTYPASRGATSPMPSPLGPGWHRPCA